MPSDADGALLIRYLAADPTFEGIGAARASRLWEALGADLYRALRTNDVPVLASVVGQEHAETLASAWAGKLAEGEVIAWLSERRFNPKLGLKVVRFWGAAALERMQDNPYILIAIASWSQVDEAARRLGFQMTHPYRQVAAVEAALYGRLPRGHTWVSAADLETLVGRLLGSGRAAARAAVSLAVAEGAVMPSGGGFQPVGANVMERYVADRLGSMLRSEDTDLLVGERAVAWALKATPAKPEVVGAVVLDELQLRAVTLALTSPVSLVLGGAGTGKTTVLGAIHEAAERVGLSVVQMSLSGLAAMRMREATGRPASTIAGFLRMCAKGATKPGADCLLVVDEASMLDLPLMYSILRRLGEGCRLLLVGDPGQLPPIGFGLTFHVLTGLPDIPKVELLQVHRQAAVTGIALIANSIRHGIVPDLPPWEVSMRQGVSFLECGEDDVRDAVTDLLTELGGTGGDTRVLAAVRAGSAGVDGLNLHLHRLRSAGKVRVPLHALAVGDPLLFTRNDYGRGIYNGSLGELLDVDWWGNLDVVFDGQRLSMRAADLSDIALAYCLTVHKAQGSQFRRIVLPVLPGAPLDRALLYTAVTRATEQVVLVGSQDAFASAVQKPSSSRRRETWLGEMLSHETVSGFS